MTRFAAKGIDNLIQKGSNVSGGRDKILSALSLIPFGLAPRTKPLNGYYSRQFKLHSADLHDDNGFRGLIIHNKETNTPVLVAALTHDEYDRTVRNPFSLSHYNDLVQNKNYKTLNFDENITSFKALYRDLMGPDVKTGTWPYLTRLAMENSASFEPRKLSKKKQKLLKKLKPC